MCFALVTMSNVSRYSMQYLVNRLCMRNFSTVRSSVHKANLNSCAWMIGQCKAILSVSGNALRDAHDTNAISQRQATLSRTRHEIIFMQKYHLTCFHIGTFNPPVSKPLHVVKKNSAATTTFPTTRNFGNAAKVELTQITRSETGLKPKLTFMPDACW